MKIELRVFVNVQDNKKGSFQDVIYQFILLNVNNVYLKNQFNST